MRGEWYLRLAVRFSRGPHTVVPIRTTLRGLRSSRERCVQAQCPFIFWTKFHPTAELKFHSTPLKVRRGMLPHERCVGTIGSSGEQRQRKGPPPRTKPVSSLALPARSARRAHTRRARSRKPSCLYLVNAIVRCSVDKARGNRERDADATTFWRSSTPRLESCGRRIVGIE
jgi:hypothetical protein